MENNIRPGIENHAKKMYVAYGLAIVCLFDWLLKLFRIIFQLDFLSLFQYLSHVFQLWQQNTLILTLILIICAFGIPEFIVSVRKSADVVQKLIKSIIRTPVIVDVPIFVYILAISFKFFLFISKFFNDAENDNAEQSCHSSGYWQAFRQTFTLYRYSTLITLTLFLLGIYTVVTNRLVHRISKRFFKIFSKQLTTIQTFITTTIPTPLSLLILISLNTIIHIFPNVSIGIFHLLIRRSSIWLIISIICFYQFYRWFWPQSKFDLDFTGDISLSDVSRLNETRIYSLFYPRTLNDIEYLIFKAKSQGRTISLRGQAHTMGGQTLPSRKRNTRNYVCDLKYLNRVEYNETTKEALVEAGATWTHVIKKLNAYGRSPVIMQSYCTFSVAGTISVNAHGITSDHAMYESVISIEYIDMNGKRNECSREKDPELFSLMIGGYGLFGIMTRLKLKTVANVKTSLEYIRLQSDQFSTYYEEFLNDPTIEIKIARVDLVRPNNILMFVFRQESGTFGIVADLADEARVMHPRQHLIYTYLAQHRPFRRVRFALEKAVARPLDLTYSTDRNLTMYESAKPMALLYQPLTYYDDTFILQEYFIPKGNFRQWYDPLKLILQKKYNHVFLLNLTIRFVKKDDVTFLAYTKQDDCFAFVFYYRIKRNQLGDDEVRSIHQQLIQLAFECGGTFYLPYRQHYSYEQILQAYPMFSAFLNRKLAYDPNELFSNDWYEHFRPEANRVIDSSSIKQVELITDEFVIVQQRRHDSFYQVITNEGLREKFRKFLQTVFNAEPTHVLFNYVNRAVRNPLNKNDHDVYRELQKVLQTRQFAFLRQVFATLKQIRQLRLQIKDMLRQQITIFKHLGCCGKIKDIVSIGDGGRCINELREILKIKDGRVYIINERERLTDIIERNSLLPVGTFIPYDFSNLTDVPIPSESVDLVVCYMGLHHLPQDQLNVYLQMVYRILRPNGLFLFREHHAYEELKPLLDVAHMVFNAVTRVDYESEINEIRAFRTIEQWRSCVRQVGFEDTFIYDEQEDDPTDDLMIVARKPNREEDLNTNESIQNGNYRRIVASPESNYYRSCEWLVVRMAIQFGQFMNHTPFFFFPFIKFLSIYWSLFRTETQLAINRYGFQRAVLSSPGFLMNAVVGVLLSGAFVQLAFFSFLVRYIGGVRTKPEYEQLILENVEDNFDFTQAVDPDIDDVQKLPQNGLYAVRVPRHGKFTTILKKIAVFHTKINLLSISNVTDPIHIELSINNNDAERLLWLKQRSNLDIVYEYTNPTDKTQIIVYVRADMKYLMAFLRECAPYEKNNSLTIIQIFEFYE
ncbi:unnamed protein product [Adineta ricciae]|uniref:FAD-binding PCMH-type domain-containing protein n=1 Tax=Adineta ricciae TaxID=249248 RepID=A0A813TU53_ADIRI|nr:unnamed protein product [Adineta ricciae]